MENQDILDTAIQDIQATQAIVGGVGVQAGVAVRVIAEIPAYRVIPAIAALVILVILVCQVSAENRDIAVLMELTGYRGLVDGQGSQELAAGLDLADFLPPKECLAIQDFQDILV